MFDYLDYESLKTMSNVNRNMNELVGNSSSFLRRTTIGFWPGDSVELRFDRPYQSAFCSMFDDNIKDVFSCVSLLRESLRDMRVDDIGHGLMGDLFAFLRHFDNLQSLELNFCGVTHIKMKNLEKLILPKLQFLTLSGCLRAVKFIECSSLKKIIVDGKEVSVSELNALIDESEQEFM